MANTLYFHDRHKHQDSMMASLNHRLDVARANCNANLVALLEQEKQQVAPTMTAGVARSGFHRAHRHWWKAATQYLADRLFGGSALQVAEIVDGSDRWWVASDPRTGQFVYADSEAELRLWIEEHYQER